MATSRISYSDDYLNLLNDRLALPDGSVDLLYLDPPLLQEHLQPALCWHGQERPACGSLH